LYNGTPSFPYTWTDPLEFVADRPIRLRASYVDGTNAKKFIDSNIGTCTNVSPNLSYLLNQEDNEIYEDINIDGSTVTECSVSGDTIKIYVDSPTNTITAQRIYSWYQYLLFTEAGIADQTGLYIRATDTTHFKFYDGMQIVNQDLSNPLNITGANVIPDSGNATDIFDLTNGASIALNFNRVEGFVYSSGSGLSPAESSLLTTIGTNVGNIKKDTGLIPACL
jgi:hypothetical protein